MRRFHRDDDGIVRATPASNADRDMPWWTLAAAVLTVLSAVFLVALVRELAGVTQRYAIAIATATAAAPTDTPDPVFRKQAELSVMTMERELTPTVTPTKAPTVAPTATLFALPSCEDLIRDGASGECVWALPTLVPPTVVACQTPMPRDRCVLFPVPTSATLEIP